jgi:hypothetical protein
MSLLRVLEDWADYDDRKKKGEDARYFSCTEPWEVEYLARKIQGIYPTFMSDKIKVAIRSCCESVKAPRPRKEMVECVLRRLSLI